MKFRTFRDVKNIYDILTTVAWFSLMIAFAGLVAYDELIVGSIALLVSIVATFVRGKYDGLIIASLWQLDEDLDKEGKDALYVYNLMKQRKEEAKINE
jgi:hypothetical protein